MSFLKNNGGLLVVGAAVLALVAGYMELRAPVLISNELSERGLVSTDKVAAMEQDIADQKETHNRDSERMDSKIERIVDILLEE